MSSGFPYELFAAGRPQRSLITSCTVSSSLPAPSSFSDPLYVVPVWQTSIYWTITRWPQLHGTALPQQGTECWVFINDLGDQAVLWWA